MSLYTYSLYIKGLHRDFYYIKIVYLDTSELLNPYIKT